MPYNKLNTLLKVDNVSKSYGDKQILHNINFDIKDIVRPNLTQGQVISLIGKSGCGKSTLFKILSGLNKPTTGTVLIDGTKPVKAGDMGVVPQNYLLFNHRSVRKNLEMAAKKNTNTKDIKTEIAKYASIFQFEDQLDKYPLQLSGGQRQRVSITQQLLTGNFYILFDEPFSGLDRLVKKEVIKVLRDVSLLNEFNTLIIVSHDFESSVSISDTVLVMGSDGKNPGSTIKKEIDLIERDLVWHENVNEMPQFRETIKEIESLL